MEKDKVITIKFLSEMNVGERMSETEKEKITFELRQINFSGEEVVVFIQKNNKFNEYNIQIGDKVFADNKLPVSEYDDIQSMVKSVIKKYLNENFKEYMKTEEYKNTLMDETDEFLVKETETKKVKVNTTPKPVLKFN